MNKNNTWNFDMNNFSNSNNIIIKALWLNQEKKQSVKHYLVVKNKNELYFYDQIELLLDYTYTIDSNLNLQFINDDNEVINEIKSEKYFQFEFEYLKEKIGINFECFIKLPLSKPLTLEEFQRKYNNPNIFLEAEINKKGIKALEKKQKKAIKYDANLAYDNMEKNKINNQTENFFQHDLE